MNPGTVLYVEDEEDDVFILRHAWKKAAIANPMHVVTDGAQAIQYLAGEAKFSDRAEYPMPFLVLLDLKLPKESGFNVLKWIRTNPAIHTLQVVVLTSSNHPEDIHRAHALGANAYLIKPPTPNGLVEMAASLRDFWIKRAETPPECLSFHGKLKMPVLFD